MSPFGHWEAEMKAESLHDTLGGRSQGTYLICDALISLPHNVGHCEGLMSMPLSERNFSYKAREIASLSVTRQNSRDS